MSDPSAAIPAVDPAGIAEIPGAALLDVREPAEFDSGHAPGAMHIPLGELPDRVETIEPDRPIVCICRSGNRSARAVAFLRNRGIDAVNLTGGMQAWAAGGNPVVTDSGAPGSVA